MKKEVIWSLAIVVVVAAAIIVYLAVAGVSSKDDGDILGVTLSPEMQQYARFEADVACQLIGITDETEFFEILGNLQETIDEYGYTASEVQELKNEYRDDADFREAAYNEMRKLCGEEMDAFGIRAYEDFTDDA